MIFCELIVSNAYDINNNLYNIFKSNKGEKMIKFSILFLLLFQVVSFSQFNVSLDIKYNLNKSMDPDLIFTTVSAGDVVVEQKKLGKIGHTFSVIGNAEITKNFSFSLGLQYNENGFDVIINQSTVTDVSTVEKFVVEKIKGFDIPINFSFPFQPFRKIKDFEIEPGLGLTLNFSNGGTVQSNNSTVKDLFNNFSLKGPVCLKFVYKAGKDVEGFLEGNYSFNFNRSGNSNAEVINSFKSNSYAFGFGIRWNIGKINIF